jgi:hypothetical protein
MLCRAAKNQRRRFGNQAAALLRMQNVELAAPVVLVLRAAGDTAANRVTLK